MFGYCYGPYSIEFIMEFYVLIYILFIYYNLYYIFKFILYIIFIYYKSLSLIFQNINEIYFVVIH